jgi:hypothetical protein
MKRYFSIVTLLICITAFSQGKPLKSFIPTGWRFVASANGDLNKDGLADMALVIEDTNPKNFIPNNEGMGHDTLNINPRHLLILFAEGKGYTLKAINKEFIPSRNQEFDFCVNDPFLSDPQEEFFIREGVLWISFSLDSVCGRYNLEEKVFKFRMHKNDVALIGYEKLNFDNLSGYESTTSINFLTRQKEVMTGKNIFEANFNHPKATKSTITLPNLIKLENLKDEWRADEDF